MARPGVIPCSAPFDSAEEWSLLNTNGTYFGAATLKLRA